MATLREYFVKDQGRSLASDQTLTITGPNKETLLDVIARLHIDLEANALYVSFYVPHSDKVTCPARIVLNSAEDVLKRNQEVLVHAGMQGQETSSSTEATFTGRIFIYSEDEISKEDREYITARSKDLGQSVKIRTNSYAKTRSEFEKPLAFISHDSRDKEAIAKPLALALEKIMCPVWYDEFSLEVGDSLRESIESGLKECRKCVFIITPNFLANGGWTKREYDSIFTRELIEERKLILPVWSGVSAKDVYEFSPILADRFASIWNGDAGKTAITLNNAIRS